MDSEQVGSDLLHGQPAGALVPTRQEETKALVVRTVRSVLTGTGQTLGVSYNWLVQHVERLGLAEEDVEALVSIRTEFRGQLPHAVKFLYQGLTVQDVCGCYRAQRSLETMEQRASVKRIAMLTRAFAEADPDNDDLETMILWAHKVISYRYFWVQYVDQSITILCAIAEKYGCATIGAALTMIESRHARHDGVLADDDAD